MLFLEFTQEKRELLNIQLLLFLIIITIFQIHFHLFLRVNLPSFYDHIDPSSSLQNGYSMCYYPLEEWENFFSELYFQRTPVDSCVLVNHPLNFTEKYHIEHVHHWPGIPDFYDKTFLMKLTGTFMITNEGEYEFYIRGTNAIRFMIDSTVVLEMGYAGASYDESSVNQTLSSGYHLLTLYYTHRDLDAHLSMKYRESKSQDWIPFSGDILFFTGRSPAFMQYPSISTSFSSSVNQLPSSIYLGAVRKFHITPDLPNGLTLNPETGAITGSLSVHIAFTLSFIDYYVSRLYCHC